MRTNSQKSATQVWVKQNASSANRRPLALVLAALALVATVCGSANAQTTLATIDVDILPSVNVGNVGFNPITKRLYVTGYSRQLNYAAAVAVLDVASGAVTRVPMPGGLGGFSFWEPPSSYAGHSKQYLAVNPSTNRIYMLGNLFYPDGTLHDVVAVMDGETNSVTFFEPVFGADKFSLGGPAYGLGIAVNPNTNRVYINGRVGPNGTEREAVAVIDGATNVVTHVYEMPTPSFDPAVPYPCRLALLGGIAVNANTNRVYLTVRSCSSTPYMAVLDGTTGEITVLPGLRFSDSPGDVFEMGSWDTDWQVAVDATTNRVFVLGRRNATGTIYVAVLDGTTGNANLIAVPDFNPNTTGLAVNPSTNRLYVVGYLSGIAIVDLSTNAVRVALRDSFTPGFSLNPAIDPATNRLYALSEFTEGNGVKGVFVVDLGSSAVTAGSNVVVQADSASIAFGAVTSAGSISVTPISDPATAGQVPGGFAISDLVAYQITPSESLIFSGAATTCFQVPAIADAAAFADLRVLHMEGGALVDRTSSHAFSTRTLCASTTSFSPFYVARVGNRVKVLFDQSRAYRAGSTIPIRVQMLNQAGANMSSSSLVLTARRLTWIGNATAVPVNDAGQANPDSAFRFDPALAGYIFNLSTKGLAAGRYCLSFWTGADHAFSYNVVFDVR